MKLHHIGIVVEDINDAFNRYRRMIPGHTPFHFEHVASQQVNVCLIRSDPAVEFIEPADSSSPVYAFCANGGGLHHLCYETENIEHALEQFEKDGTAPASPAVGLEGRKVVFVHLSTNVMGMTLIELIE